MDNVTTRIHKKFSSMTSLGHSTLMDDTMFSMPNTSLNESITITTLNTKIETLSAEVSTANHEIDNLSLENKHLKEELGKCYKLIETLKKVGSQSTYVTPKSSGKKRRRMIKKTSSPDTINGSLMSTPKNLNENDKIKIINNNKDEIVQSVENSYNEEITEYPKDTINIVAESQKKPQRGKIIVIADQQGWRVQQELQNLVGTEYTVTSIWKSGARMHEVLSSAQSDILKLTKNDFVLVMGGTNENNPYEFQSNLISSKT